MLWEFATGTTLWLGVNGWLRLRVGSSGRRWGRTTALRGGARRRGWSRAGGCPPGEMRRVGGVHARGRIVRRERGRKRGGEGGFAGERPGGVRRVERGRRRGRGWEGVRRERRLGVVRTGAEREGRGTGRGAEGEVGGEGGEGGATGKTEGIGRVEERGECANAGEGRLARVLGVWVENVGLCSGTVGVGGGGCGVLGEGRVGHAAGGIEISCRMVWEKHGGPGRDTVEEGVRHLVPILAWSLAGYKEVGLGGEQARGRLMRSRSLRRISAVMAVYVACLRKINSFVAVLPCDHFGGRQWAIPSH